MLLLNRFIIFVVILAVLYALYKYQYQIDNSDTNINLSSNKDIKPSVVEREQTGFDNDSIDNITIDNVSQFTFDSCADIRPKRRSTSRLLNKKSNYQDMYQVDSAFLNDGFDVDSIDSLEFDK